MITEPLYRIGLIAVAVVLGSVLCAAQNAGDRRELVWYDRAGKVLGIVYGPDSDRLSYPELSPDGRSVAFQRRVAGLFDVWLLNFADGHAFRLTSDAVANGDPVWSPDGSQLAFASSRRGLDNLYLKSSAAGGSETVLLENANSKTPLDWSPDGQFLIYCEVDPKTGKDLWALPMKGGAEAKPLTVAHTSFNEANGQFSPDGRWVAYETDESGRNEIAVQTFPQAGAKQIVSRNGGIQPRWRADGKELYFIAPDGQLMAVPVEAGRDSLKAGTPVALFRLHIPPGGSANRHQYAVAHDGRFLVNQLLP